MYDSDSEDEADDTEMILGFEDGPVASTSALDATTSKLGGQPVFWPAYDKTPDVVTCATCVRQMALLAQLYIPQAGHEEQHRALYIFACLQKACQKFDCVRVFTACRRDDHLAAAAAEARRVEMAKFEANQKSFANPFSSTFSSTFTSSRNPFAETMADNDAIGPCEGERDTLCTRLDTLKLSAETRPAENWPVTIPLLPAYYIATDYEPPATPSSAHPREPSANSSWNMKDDAGWKGEGYESLGERDRIFLAFQTRLARGGCQAQLVRVGPAPLAFCDGPTEPDNVACPACGKHRVFEVQIMPRAVDLLERSLGESKGQGIDWATVMIWTCPSTACAGTDNQATSWNEEGVRLQYE